MSVIIESSFVEMSWRLAFAGKEVNYNGEWVVIKDIDFEPRTRQLTVETECGKQFLALKDDPFEWKYTESVQRKKPTHKRMRRRRKNQ